MEPGHGAARAAHSSEDDAAVLVALHRRGLGFGAGLESARVLRAVTEAALDLSGGAFSAYLSTGPSGEGVTLCSASGTVPPSLMTGAAAPGSWPARLLEPVLRLGWA